ncbi:MAG: hypothetical protein Q4B40_02950 [Clostridia bacterium]|nr:hypothetical protein [Clostridia bacterium]
MIKKFAAILLSALTVVFALNPFAFSIKSKAQKATLNISVVTKNEKNDLLLTLTSNYKGVKHYTSLDDALNNAATNQTKGIMVLADNYPDSDTAVTESQATKINSLGVKLYIEYPSNNTSLGITGYTDTRVMDFDRAVVTDADKMGMAKNSILYVHGAKYKAKLKNSKTWLANATVAGYDTADFGLTDCTAYSMIETNASGNVLIASTKLSQFISARYAPYERWQKLWIGVISWLSGTRVANISWTPSVKAKYNKGQALSANAYKDAVNLNSQWYINNMLPADGKGVYQCYQSGSNFDPFGNQTLNQGVRADCTAETVGAMAMAGAVTGNQKYKDNAYKIMKWMINESDMANGDRANPNSSQYGLFSWYNGINSYYGDDNAKAIIGLILATEALGTDEFDKRILEAITANFRTAGQNGFRGSVLNADDLDKNGWENYFNGNVKNYASHFESLIWACYLWAYEKTDYEPFLIRTKTALTMMMASYVKTMQDPDILDLNYYEKWNWTNSLQADRAKLILPLAWLVRIEPTEEHIKWLDLIVTDMMATQDSSTGAIRDTVGEEWQGYGSCGPFTKNSEYGTHESPVIQNNGDPCTDALYTSNFAAMSLNEAYSAVKAAKNSKLASKYQKYVKSTSDYLVRIQQASADSKYNGVWFRGFDYKKWETYGSDGDAGWGIWVTESGWTQSFISYSLSLQSMGTNMWDYTSKSSIGKHFDSVKKTMLNYQFAIPDYQPDLSKELAIINDALGIKGDSSNSTTNTDVYDNGFNKADEESEEYTDDGYITIDDDDSADKKNYLWLWITAAAVSVVAIAGAVFACIKISQKSTANGETQENDDSDKADKSSETEKSE